MFRMDFIILFRSNSDRVVSQIPTRSYFDMIYQHPMGYDKYTSIDRIRIEFSIYQKSKILIIA
jgi:hypothetical protein